MSELRYANIALDIFSMMLSSLPVIYLISNHRYRLKLNQYFLGICLSNILMTVGDLGDWMMPAVITLSDRVTLMVLTVLYYAASAFILYFFIRYIIEYLQLRGRVKQACLLYTICLCSVQIIFAAISPFTGSIFRVTVDGYQRGPLFLLSQFIPLFCYILCIVLVIAYRDKLSRRETMFFLLYIFLPLGSGTAQMAMRGIAVVNASLTIAMLLILMNIQFEHEVAMKEQEKELAERHIDVMLSQIQPHFLYNSLSVIYHLCEENPGKAQKSIKEFSAFLRGNMNSLKARKPIPFETELNHVMNYLYLERQRFQERLHVVCQIQTTDFYIPPLTLQPLVENAVQHGILNKDEGGTISICTNRTAEYAIVTIMDNGIGMEKAKTYTAHGAHAHIGIENVRQRLKSMVNGTLDIESNERGTVVTLQIPWTGR